MSNLKIAIFQFNGCTNCNSEIQALQVKFPAEMKHAEIIDHPKEWKPSQIDFAIITGYLLPSDKEIIELIIQKAEKVIGFGNCPVTGGIFGLAKQKGHQFLPLQINYPGVTLIHGCVGNISELVNILGFENAKIGESKKLCHSCSRKSTCEFLDEVFRQIDISEDLESCFNDLGFLCSGYIADDCSERCIDFGTPCRGCHSKIDRPGFRMIGMFATLMANVEVASEATPDASTDKLSDEDDDVTKSFPDVTGSFFRYNFANNSMPLGKIKSSGDLFSDVFIARPIEELPLISGSIGGNYNISLTLDIIEAYELENKIEINQNTTELRIKLRKIEKDRNEARSQNDFTKYIQLSTQIRNIAGNLILSNLYYGGFKVSLQGIPNFEESCAHPVEIQSGIYVKDSLSYTLNEDGVVTKFQWKESKEAQI